MAVEVTTVLQRRFGVRGNKRTVALKYLHTLTGNDKHITTGLSYIESTRFMVVDQEDVDCVRTLNSNEVGVPNKAGFYGDLVVTESTLIDASNVWIEAVGR